MPVSPRTQDSDERPAKSASKRLKYSIYEVVWSDTSYGHGWTDRTHPDIRPVAIVSVGFLFKNDPDFVALTSSYGSGGDAQVMSPLTIPRSAIIRIKKIRWPPA